IGVNSHQLENVKIDCRGLAAQGILGVVSALVFRGGLFLNLFGFAVVSAGGARASRVRAFLRGSVAWLPLITFIPLYFYSSLDNRLLLMLPHLGLAVLLAGAVCAVATPERGLQDRIAGTYLVPL